MQLTGKRVLIAGGTGLIGNAIQKAMAKEDWEVVILSRSRAKGHMVWDPAIGEMFITGPHVFDVIINLAGTSISAKRWTAHRKKMIAESRTDACRTLRKYLADGRLITSAYIGASAVGIYGDRSNEVVDDNSAIHEEAGWMSRVVQAWEEGHRSIEALGVRTAILRIGIVMSRKGGALKEMLITSPFGFLAFFGNGNQYWPWIHIDDLTGIIQFCIADKEKHGIYLAVAPEEINQREWVRQIARKFTPRRLVLGVPEFWLRLLLGKMSQMLLDSCRGKPVRLVEENYSFRYTDLQNALGQLFGKQPN